MTETLGEDAQGKCGDTVVREGLSYCLTGDRVIRTMLRDQNHNLGLNRAAKSSSQTHRWKVKRELSERESEIEDPVMASGYGDSLRVGGLSDMRIG
ncbi:hypothetical protein PM082_022054 [Marasmius tenuissimus]|nr:hypothetical protein PM082_022054 [Marasmius tenuissimus]